MGARPSSFKQGGGFLNGVDGRITDYQLTDQFNGEPFVPGKMPSYDNPTKKIDKPHDLNVLLSVRVDGAEEDTVTTLKAASDFDTWKVSDDGHEVIGIDGDGNEMPDKGFGAGSAFSKFVTSLCKPASGGQGFPEERFPEDRLNWDVMIGTRVRFIQQVDEARTKKFGQKANKKTGKAYDRKDLVVDEVYELPEVEGAAAPAKTSAKKPGVSAKQPAAPAVKPLGKGKAAKVVEPTVDIDDLTSTTLVDILTEDGGSIQKSKLSMRVLKALMKDPNRGDVRKRIFEDDFLTGEDAPWTYDKATGVITLAA
jgi:hypothetical protein